MLYMAEIMANGRLGVLGGCSLLVSVALPALFELLHL